MSNPPGTATRIAGRLAGGPISWGVCEVPGWGLQLPPDRVLDEMRSLGLRATEAGPSGYLGRDADSVRALLAAHGLELVGGFLPVVLHDEARLADTLASVRRTVELFAETGGRVLCSGVVVDEGWSQPFDLSDREWRHLLSALPRLDEIAAECGLVHILHPHWGTLVERDDDLRRILEGSEVRICLDTGHLTLGGTDSVALAQEACDRIAHVHLKDVHTDVAAQLLRGELSFLGAVRSGLFRPLGGGDAPIGAIVDALEDGGYDGLYVLEQDATLSAEEAGQSCTDDVARSIAFLESVVRGRTPLAAPRRREVRQAHQLRRDTPRRESATDSTQRKGGSPA